MSASGVERGAPLDQLPESDVLDHGQANLTGTRARGNGPVASHVVTGTRLTGDLLRDAAQAAPRTRRVRPRREARPRTRGSTAPRTGSRRRCSTAASSRGDVVCLMLPSSIKFAACYAGALRAGAITSAINLRLGPREQASIIARTEPRVTVLGDGADRARGCRRRHACCRSTELASAFAADPPPAARLPALDRRRTPTCIVWTSGTTGRPEGRRLRPRSPGRRSPATSGAHRARRPSAGRAARSHTSAT